jgi:hypothetical protein
MLLEVTSDFVESVSVSKIVYLLSINQCHSRVTARNKTDHVGSIEQLSDGKVDIISRSSSILLGVVREIERKIFGDGTIVVLPRVLTFPVLVREDLRKTRQTKQLNVPDVDRLTLLPQAVSE